MVFGDGQSNSVIQIYPEFFVVAMATKFWTKWAITRLLLEMLSRVTWALLKLLVYILRDSTTPEMHIRPAVSLDQYDDLTLNWPTSLRTLSWTFRVSCRGLNSITAGKFRWKLA